MNLLEKTFEKSNLESSCSFLEANLRKISRGHPGSQTKRKKDIEILGPGRDRLVERILSESQSPNGYTFSRLIFPVPKNEKGKAERPISIFRLDDRVVCRALLNVLWPILSPHVVRSVAYCTFRDPDDPSMSGVVNAVLALKDARDAEKVWFFETDIEGFYDRINREKLLETLAPLLQPDTSVINLVLNLLHAETRLSNKMEGITFDSNGGVPQGAALSPLLACMYLSPFDRAVQHSGLKMVRYVDDIVVLCKSEEHCEETKLYLVELLEQEFKLKLNLAKKTRNIGPYEQIDFLGHTLLPNGRLRLSRKRKRKFIAGIYRRVAALPGLTDREIASDLTSHILGYFAQTKHCVLSPRELRLPAKCLKRALVARNLQPNRLTRLLGKASAKWPHEFLDELRKSS